MKKLNSLNDTKPFLSERLPHIYNQNHQFTFQINDMFNQNKTQFNQEQSQQFQTKQLKLIQLLICVKLLEMGVDWRNHTQQIQTKLQQNKNATIGDVPRMVNQLIPSFIKMKSFQKKKQLFSKIQQHEVGNESLSSLFVQKSMKKQGHQIILVGKQLQLCLICYQQSYQCIKLPCSHIFCKSCIISTIKQNLNSGKHDAICPDYACGTPMPDSILSKIIQKDTFQRLKYFQAKQALQRNPLNKFCSRPDCGQLLILTSKHLQCIKCQKLYCKQCLQQKHENKCDQQLLKKLKNMYDSHQVKKCPKCKSPIQKGDGCNHMTCTKCKFSFCWICLSQYTDHHYRYYNCFGCPGMQFEDQSEIVYLRVKQTCFFLFFPLLLLLLLLAFLLFLPIFVMCTFLLRPCFWAPQYEEFCQSKFIVNKICCCCRNLVKGKIVLAYFILLPRSLLYALFIAPYNLLCYLYNDIVGSMY